MHPRTVLPLLLALAAGAWAGQPAAAAAESPQLVDRVVAVVDEDPILDSDIERVVRLGLLPAVVGESVAEERRRALDLAIEQRLRLHEVDRFGFEETPLALLDRQMEEIRSRVPAEEAFRAELARLGLDETALRQLLARQLSVLAYVEERLGPRVFVSVDDIGRYYNEVGNTANFLSSMANTMPPMLQVMKDIGGVELPESLIKINIDRDDTTKPHTPPAEATAK